MYTDVFTINVTTEKNCEVRLKDTKLDHEHAESYQLKIRLDTLAGVVNPTKSTTMVNNYIVHVPIYNPRSGGVDGQYILLQ